MPPPSLPLNQSPRTSQHEARPPLPSKPLAWRSSWCSFTLHRNPSSRASAGSPAPLPPTVVRGGPAAGSVRRSRGSHHLRFVKVLA